MTTVSNIPKTAQQTLLLARASKTQELWLNGRRAGEIALELGLSIGQVTGDIRKFRNQLYEDNKATQAEHIEQSVTVFRRAQAILWDEYNDIDQTLTITQKIKVIDEIRQLEMNAARVRGIVNSTIINNVFTEIKMYDFKDNYPSEPSQRDKVIDATAKLMPELTPPPANDLAEYPTQGEYDTDVKVIPAPDGTLMEKPNPEEDAS